MATIGTSSEFARALQAKLVEGDLDWLRARFLAGDLNFLRDLLPASERAQFPRRLDDRDLGWIRTVLAAVVIPGVGPLAVPVAAPTVPPAPVVPNAAPRGPTAPGGTSRPAMPGEYLGEPAFSFGPDYSPDTDFTLDPVTPTARPNTSRTPQRWWIVVIPVVAVLALVALVFVRSRGDDPGTAAPITTSARTTTVPATANLARTLEAEPRLSTLFAAVRAAGLADVLADPAGVLTVFAPTNDAFAALAPGRLDALLADPAALRKVLLYHVASGRWTSVTAKTGELPVLDGPPLKVARTGNTLTVGGATVVSADLTASNGVVHLLDRVLLPPDGPTPTGIGTTAAATTGAATTGAATTAAATTGVATTTATTAASTTVPAGPTSTTGPGIDVVVKFPTPNGVTLDAQATAVVNDLAAAIKRLPAGAVVKVTGWSDTRGGERAALDQSKARADAVVAALRAAGATSVTYTVTGAGGRWAAVYADARVVEVDLP
ncbi:MAG: fasciclin domain-containing protein [Acidimicrobiales bacterium]